MIIPDELLKMIKPDNMLKIHYGEYNINNALINIRAIIDDEQIVFKAKYEGSHKWKYCIESWYYFLFRFKLGKLNLIGDNVN